MCRFGLALWGPRMFPLLWNSIVYDRHGNVTPYCIVLHLVRRPVSHYVCFLLKSLIMKGKRTRIPKGLGHSRTGYFGPFRRRSLPESFRRSPCEAKLPYSFISDFLFNDPKLHLKFLLFICGCSKICFISALADSKRLV